MNSREDKKNSLAALVANLCEVTSKLTGFYSEYLEIKITERNLLVKRDLKRLPDLNRRVFEIKNAVTSLEEGRIAIQKSIASFINADPVEILSYEATAKALPAGMSGEILKKGRELKEIIKNIKAAEKLTSDLIDMSLKHINKLYDIGTTAIGMKKAKMYNAKGESTAKAGSVTQISKEA